MLAAEPELAATDANNVTRAQCFDVLDARKATPMATAKLRSMLGSAWEFALDAGRLDGNTPNWWRQLMQGKLKSKGKVMGGKHVGQSRRALRNEEIAALLGWLGNMHQIGRDAVVMYLWTCARGSEIFAMRPEHVAKEGAVLWWTVPKELTKNARFAEAVDLRVPLFGQARQVVERRLASVGRSGFLFENGKGEQYTQHAFSTYIYDLQPYSPKAKRRGSQVTEMPVTNWTPHNLRRTGRTLLAALGCPREIAEAVVGHMPPAIEATYNVHTYDAERVEWLQRLDAHLASLASVGAPARP
jgi:integrase